MSISNVLNTAIKIYCNAPAKSIGGLLAGAAVTGAATGTSAAVGVIGASVLGTAAEIALLTGSTSMLAGAAAGSTVLPVVGTVLGAAAGFGVSAVAKSIFG